MDKGECVGGSTLSLLHDRSFNYTGDSQAQELCLYLTKAASVPYFEILEKWIYRGIINDPYRWGWGCGGRAGGSSAYSIAWWTCRTQIGLLAAFVWASQCDGYKRI